ncbi:MAG: ferredoxin-type protein NapG [Bacteroidetes bacterium 4572_77]|nr:MAG: ferredoxin-type protein NapG [Bacteroidetes bacterium 4572_77]
MSKQTNNINRREAILKTFQGAGLLSLGGLVWGAFLNKAKASKLVLRPPAAISEDDFLSACIKCGACVQACPYDTLHLAQPQDEIPIGTPYFIPRDIPCHMCPDVPCVPVCPTTALDINKLIPEGKEATAANMDVNKSDMGLAVIDEKSCIAFWGIQCDACYRACPLINEALSLEFERNERTGKHAFLKPIVHPDICTGCGMCERACVTEKAAISVLPRKVVEGKVGNFYLKGWDAKDEDRLKEETNENPDLKGRNTDDDYLNDWEDLIDE